MIYKQCERQRWQDAKQLYLLLEREEQRKESAANAKFFCGFLKLHETDSPRKALIAEKVAIFIFFFCFISLCSLFLSFVQAHFHIYFMLFLNFFKRVVLYLLAACEVLFVFPLKTHSQ